MKIATKISITTTTRGSVPLMQHYPCINMKEVNTYREFRINHVEYVKLTNSCLEIVVGCCVCAAFYLFLVLVSVINNTAPEPTAQYSTVVHTRCFSWNFVGQADRRWSGMSPNCLSSSRSRKNPFPSWPENYLIQIWVLIFLDTADAPEMVYGPHAEKRYIYDADSW